MSNVSSAEELSWLAIHQPGVVHLLEHELCHGDGDAFAAGLELACRLFGEQAALDGLPLPRLEPRLLAAGQAAVDAGACDPRLRAWLRGQLAELPVLLAREEERAVVSALAGVLWAAAEVRAVGVSPTAVA